jgi:hypothetical protein
MAAWSPLNTLIEALPVETLRQVLLTMLQNGAPPVAPPAPAPQDAPARRKPGRPRKPGPDADALKERRDRAARAARLKRARRKANPANGTGKPVNGTNGAAEVAPGQAFWQHAERLRPRDPWVAVARELGVNPALSKDHYRGRTMPPGIADTAVARFLELSVG